MTTLALAYSNINKKVRSFSLPTVNWKAYCFCALLLSIILGVFYVIQVNQMIYGSYTVKGYQKQIETLQEEGKILEADFARTSFMGTIGQKTQEMSFEKVKTVKYMQMLDTSAFLSNNNNN